MHYFGSIFFHLLFWIGTEMLKIQRKSKEIIKKLAEFKSWTDKNDESPDFWGINKWKFFNNFFLRAF